MPALMATLWGGIAAGVDVNRPGETPTDAQQAAPGQVFMQYAGGYGPTDDENVLDRALRQQAQPSYVTRLVGG